MLLLSRWYPYRPDNGSKIRILNMIRQLACRHDVSLVSFVEGPAGTEVDVEDSVREACVEVQTVPYRRFRPNSPKAALGLLSLQPRALVDTFRPEMQSAAALTLDRRGCDVAIASQLDMMPYGCGLRGVPLVLEELELSTYRDRTTRP